jgi:hypothetical protein
MRSRRSRYGREHEGSSKQEKCHFKMAWILMKIATCLLKRQASAYRAVISTLSRSLLTDFSTCPRPDYDFIRERGIPSATISRGLLPAACGSKNLVVSSS